MGKTRPRGVARVGLTLLLAIAVVGIPIQSCLLACDLDPRIALSAATGATLLFAWRFG